MSFRWVVWQLFATEQSRHGMESSDIEIHQYPFELIFNKRDSEVSTWKRALVLFKKLSNSRPKIINISGYYDLGVVLPAMLSKLFFKSRIIVSVDGLQSNHSNPLKKLLKKIIFYFTDGFFSYGTTPSQELLKLGVKKNKILMERNAVDNDFLEKTYSSFLEKDTSPFFLYLGRLVPEKNLKMLLLSFMEVRNKEWKLKFVGDGPEKEELIKIAKNESNISFLEKVNWREVPMLFGPQCVLVLPSLSEPWGLVVNEAMACGIPVLVASSCGCVKDLVRENGKVFNPNSSLELRESLKWFIENTHLFSKMGLRGKEIIKNFEPQLVAKDMTLVFNNFLKERSSYNE